MTATNIVLILDRSGSMSTNNYLEAAQTDSSTFTNIMHVQDQLGVVAFESSSRIIFPVNGASALVTLTNQGVKTSAVNQIMAQTTAGMTNMTAAIASAHGMIASAAQPRAIVMLSDGMANTGGDPLTNLPTDVPIHTIALGPSSGITTLEQIAYRTVGQGIGYHYAPNAFDLAAIYNSIAQNTKVAAVPLNKRQPLTRGNFVIMTAPLASGSDEVYMAVNWLDRAVTYTTGTPGVNQISILLKDPNGNLVTPVAAITGQAFVVLTVANPIPGNWTVGVWTGNVSVLDSTTAAFEPDQASSASLMFTTPEAKCGQPVGFQVSVDHDGSSVPGAVVHSVIEAPEISFDEALITHKNAIDALDVSDTEGDFEDPLRRLGYLQNKILEQGKDDILRRIKSPGRTAETSDGRHEGEIVAPSVPGPYTVHAAVTMKHPINGEPISRTVRGSINVR